MKWTPIVAMICIAGLEVMAMAKGINGAVFLEPRALTLGASNATPIAIAIQKIPMTITASWPPRNFARTPARAVPMGTSDLSIK